MTHLLNLLAAIALLVWGTQLVRTGILRVLGANLRNILARSVTNRLTAAASGIGVTALLQSSTATALIVSSFVGQGLMSLPGALAVMLGADIGTKVAPQLGLPGVGSVQHTRLAPMVAQNCVSDLALGPVTQPVDPVALVAVQHIGHLQGQLVELAPVSVLTEVAGQRRQHRPAGRNTLQLKPHRRLIVPPLKLLRSTTIILAPSPRRRRRSPISRWPVPSDATRIGARRSRCTKRIFWKILIRRS